MKLGEMSPRSVTTAGLLTGGSRKTIKALCLLRALPAQRNDCRMKPAIDKESLPFALCPIRLRSMTGGDRISVLRLSSATAVRHCDKLSDSSTGSLTAAGSLTDDRISAFRLRSMTTAGGLHGVIHVKRLRRRFNNFYMGVRKKEVYLCRNLEGKE